MGELLDGMPVYCCNFSTYESVEKVWVVKGCSGLFAVEDEIGWSRVS